MKILKLLTPLYIIILFAGCTIIDGGAIITGIVKKPISISEVRVYRVAPKNYEEIAMLSASSGHDFKSNSSLINSTIQRLKEEAAKIGANGVLLAKINERDATNTTISYGNVQAHANNGSSMYASGNSFNINRGDAYTRMQGLAIYVPE